MWKIPSKIYVVLVSHKHVIFFLFKYYKLLSSCINWKINSKIVLRISLPYAFTRYQKHLLLLKKKLGQMTYMLNINTHLHLNLYLLHWADTSVLFIILEKNIQTHFWEVIKTQQSWGSGRSVLRIILMRSGTWNVVTFEQEYPEERRHKVALAWQGQKLL